MGSSWDMILGGIGFHPGCKSVSGYCYHCCVLGAIITGCVDVCLEKKREDSGVKQVLGICPMEARREKCGDSGAGCCWTVVVGW